MIFVGSPGRPNILSWEVATSIFFKNNHSYLGRMFTHFDLRIFFKGVGEKPPSSWHIGR